MKVYGKIGASNEAKNAGGVCPIHDGDAPGQDCLAIATHPEGVGSG